MGLCNVYVTFTIFTALKNSLKPISSHPFDFYSFVLVMKFMKFVNICYKFELIILIIKLIIFYYVHIHNHSFLIDTCLSAEIALWKIYCHIA